MVLVVGHSVGVVMPVHQGHGEAGLLRAVPGRLVLMPVIFQDVRSQPEPLRQGRGGQEDENDGERLARRHARIVAQSAARGQTPYRRPGMCRSALSVALSARLKTSSPTPAGAARGIPRWIATVCDSVYLRIPSAP